MSRGLFAAVVAAVGVALGTGGCAPEPPEVEDLPPAGHAADAGASGEAEIVALLNRANESFRERDLDTALELYRQVRDRAPDLSSGWFGIFMVHSLRGEQAAADSAFRRAMELGPPGEPSFPGSPHAPADPGAGSAADRPGPHTPPALDSGVPNR